MLLHGANIIIKYYSGKVCWYYSSIILYGDDRLEWHMGLVQKSHSAASRSSS